MTTPTSTVAEAVAELADTGRLSAETRKALAGVVGRDGLGNEVDSDGERKPDKSDNEKGKA